MSTQPCSYEIQPPTDDDRLRLARVHPDPEVYARMAASARGHMARRFALCRYLEGGPRTSSSVACEYLGWKHRDGVTITDTHGHPIGWYTSLDTAHHHISQKRATSLWLVWLEAAPGYTNATQAAAAVEAGKNDTEMFIIGVGFIAAGPTDARLHAIQLVETAETFLPDVQRHAVVTHGINSGPVGVYCRQFGCVQLPGHPGDHHIAAPEPGHHQPPKHTADDVDHTPEEHEVIDHARTHDTTDEDGSVS